MAKRRNRNPNEPYRHPDHRRPVTRREFLGQGFLSGAAMVVGPSLATFLARSARAQCAVGGFAGGKIPFIVFDLGGGASTAGSNVMAGGPGGQLDPLSESGYEKMGLPASMTLLADPTAFDEQLGLRFHPDSAFLRGIIERTSQTTRDNVNGTLFAARSDNDTGNNPHNPMYGIARAGAGGDIVTLIGTENSNSGGRSDIPMATFDPEIRPTKVDRRSDAMGLVDTGQLNAIFPNSADAQAVMKAAEDISAAKVALLPEDPTVQQIINCSFVETTDLVGRFGSPAQLDPEADVNIQAIFTPGELDQSEFRKTAAVMKLVVEGYAGAGTIEFGGYDYHDSTRATGENKDLTAGRAMGAVLEYAALNNTPVVIYVLSDGSVASDGGGDNDPDARGKLIWKGDNSSTAGTFMLVYDPDGRPALTAPSRHQIGYYRQNGSVETNASRIADNVPSLADAVVLNYMALHGEVGSFATVLPQSNLGSTPAELDPLTAFAMLPRFV